MLALMVLMFTLVSSVTKLPFLSENTSQSSKKLVRVKMFQVLQLWEKKSVPVMAAAKMIVIKLDQSHLFQASHPLSPEDSASLHYLYYLLLFSVSLHHYLNKDLHFPAPTF